MSTKKLYDTDSHIRSFDAVVMGCTEENKKGKKVYAVLLDQTAFFAEGGGQAADRGTITLTELVADNEARILAAEEKGDYQRQTFKVLDVQEKDGLVYHYIDEKIPEGTKVHGELDWAFRYDNMQQHSGEHILSGICYAWKGYHNVGFHLGEAFTTVDFDGPLSDEELRILEERTNQVIYENQPVSISYPTKEELARMDYRSKKELSGDVRIVKVGDYDLCACCAPHVRLTGEVGLVKIVRSENYKGGVRLTILCGQRALKDYAYKNQLIYQLAASLSTKPEQIADALAKRETEAAELKEHNLQLSRKLASFRLEELEQKAKMQGGSVLWVEDLLDPVAARSLVNQLTERVEGYVLALIPKGKGNEFTYIGASRLLDARKLSASLKEAFGARGGGSERMVQGSIAADPREIEESI